jgi:hypothetical protein
MRSLIWWTEVPGASDRGVMPALGRAVARARGPIIAEAPGAPGRATQAVPGSEAPGRDARIEERSVGSGGARRPRPDARRCALRARGRDHRVSRLPGRFSAAFVALRPGVPPGRVHRDIRGGAGRRSGRRDAPRYSWGCWYAGPEPRFATRTISEPSIRAWTSASLNAVRPRSSLISRVAAIPAAVGGRAPPRVAWLLSRPRLAAGRSAAPACAARHFRARALPLPLLGVR